VAVIVKISLCPLRFEEKAIFDPSGDHAGVLSSPVAFDRFWKPLRAPATVVGNVAVQISRPLDVARVLSKAIWAPLGDHVGAV
jgi:hypothetical protein